MIKHALVVVRPQSKVVKNIGDFIQTIAVAQFSDKSDYYIDREELCHFKSDDGSFVKAIINGCFIWKKENWPPSNNILPLFISMHIFPHAEEGMFTADNINYWKSHSPIGCRDLNTLEMFKRRNIDAYFSACVTLTLDKKYLYKGNRKGIIFVDPYIPLPLFKNGICRKKIILSEVLSTFWNIFIHYKIISKLSKHNFFSLYGPRWGHSHYTGLKKKIMTLYQASQFYKYYSQKFTDKLLLSSEFITHMYRLRQDIQETDDDLCKVAENLVCKYSKAKMVITSRIHAALPCLALNTPVIFILSKEMESKQTLFNTPGRFGGIIDLFRCMKIGEKTLVSEDKTIGKLGKIDVGSFFINKLDYKDYSDKLKKTINTFLNS